MILLYRQGSFRDFILIWRIWRLRLALTHDPREPIAKRTATGLAKLYSQIFFHDWCTNELGDFSMKCYESSCKFFFWCGTFTSVSSDRWRLLNSLIVAAISDVGSLAWNRKRRKLMNNKEPKAYTSSKLLLPEQEQQLPTVDLVPRSQGQPVSI